MSNSGSVGLVLGAGGPFALVYHLGVLEALRASALLDPASASRVVGTSAGASVAASLVAGISSREILEALAAFAPYGLLHEIGAMRTAARGTRDEAPASTPAVVEARTPGRQSRAGRLAGRLPGLLPTHSLANLPTGTATTWDRRLWIPAVRVHDGATVVFGRDICGTTVADAIEASSAVPLLCRPKVIAGARYVDGALTSPTHADALLDERLDIVVVSAPMLQSRRPWVRRWTRHRIAAEASALRRTGVRVIILGPDADVMQAARGYPLARREARWEIAAAARRSAATALASWTTGDAQDD